MDDQDVLSMLYVLTDRIAASELQGILLEALRPENLVLPDGQVPRVGVSTLPHDAGAWVRMVGDDVASITGATTLAWRAVRRALTGVEAPTIRKC